MADVNGNFVNEAYATPEQLAQMRAYAAHLLKPETAKSGLGVLANGVSGLIGGLMQNRANEVDQANYARMTHNLEDQFKEVQGGGPGGDIQQSLGADAGNVPRSIANNNPGNLVDNAYTQRMPGYAGSDGHFARFADPQSGIAAAGQNLTSYAHQGIRTINDMAAKWAPSGDGNNDPKAYAATIAKATGIPPDAAIDLSNPGVQAKILPVIGSIESGRPIAYGPQGQPSGIVAALMNRGGQPSGGVPPGQAGAMNPQAVARILSDPNVDPATKSALADNLRVQTVPNGAGGHNFVSPIAPSPRAGAAGYITGNSTAGNVSAPSATPVPAQPGQLGVGTAGTVGPSLDVLNAKANELKATNAPIDANIAQVNEARTAYPGLVANAAKLKDAATAMANGASGWQAKLIDFAQGHGFQPEGTDQVQILKQALTYLQLHGKPAGLGNMSQNEFNTIGAASGDLNTSPGARKVISKLLMGANQYELDRSQAALNDYSTDPVENFKQKIAAMNAVKHYTITDDKDPEIQAIVNPKKMSAGDMEKTKAKLEAFLAKHPKDPHAADYARKQLIGAGVDPASLGL